MVDVEAVNAALTAFFSFVQSARSDPEQWAELERRRSKASTLYERYKAEERM